MVYGYTVPPILCLSYMVVSGHLQVQVVLLTRVNSKNVKVAVGQARRAQRGRCIALLFLQHRRWMRRVVNATTQPLYPREISGTHCIGGWVDPRAGLDGCGKYL
jgi:hypothetical protein